MKRSAILVCALFICLTSVSVCFAHFGAIIPSDDIVTQNDSKKITLAIEFIHPFEGHFMEMAKPQKFGVLHRGHIQQLLASLEAAKAKGTGQDKTVTYWKASYKIKSPGDYTFFVQPSPYWEPAEDTFIVHYTKVCVNALGLEAGWDQPVGLETEIVPLTRPYGLWVGNLFQGQVLLNGKPAPDTEVEVEYLNASPENPCTVQAPADPFVTQVIKTDANGVFSYAMPRAGWWGFAALHEASWKLEHNGEEKPVEIGAVFWVRATGMNCSK